MGNKKIAVVFAGQPRTFRQTFKSHLDFFKLDGYDFDYFIHGWSEQWYRTKTGTKLISSNALIENINELKDELIKIYSPKAITIEPQRDCEDLIKDMQSLMHLQKTCNCCSTPSGAFWGNPKDPLKAMDQWLNGTHAGQVYSWQKATNLKIDYQQKNNINYDGVIKFRLDNILDHHPEVRKQKFLDQICNYERGGFINRDKDDEHRIRMRFQWQNKPPRNYWNVGDMMFGGPNHIFDKLMKDIYIFHIRSYCKMIGNLNGKWSHIGSSEGVLGKKLVFEEIGTDTLQAAHFPYRDYHLSHPDQSYKALHQVRQEADEGSVLKTEFKK